MAAYHGEGLQVVEDVGEDGDEDELVLEADPDGGQLDELRVDLGGGDGGLGLDGGLELVEPLRQLQLQALHVLGAVDDVVEQGLEADLVLAHVDERVGEQLARVVAEEGRRALLQHHGVAVRALERVVQHLVDLLGGRGHRLNQKHKHIRNLVCKFEKTSSLLTP